VCAYHFVQLDLCSALELKMSGEIGNLNVYALDYPVCLEDSNPARYAAHCACTSKHAHGWKFTIT
jgi:hypothetical protein